MPSADDIDMSSSWELHKLSASDGYKVIHVGGNRTYTFATYEDARKFLLNSRILEKAF